MEGFWLLLALLLPGLATGALANWKGRSPWGWALAGFVFSFIAAPLLVLLILPRACRECRQPLEPQSRSLATATVGLPCGTCGQPLPDRAAGRRIGVWIPATAIALFALAVCLAYLEKSAGFEARSFCEKAIAGQPIAPLASEALTTGVKPLRMIGAQSVSVGFVGVPPFSRHLCTIEARDGYITKAYVSRLD